MHGFGLSNRGEDIVKMGAKRLQQFGQHRIIALFDQAEEEHQFGADTSDCTEPTEGRTEVEGVVEQMEQEIEVIGARYGVLTRMMGVCIVLETLVEMGLACGVVACLRRLVLLGNGRIGFALQLAAPVQEVATRMKPITHPARVLARRMRARHEATSPIRSHADAVEAVMTEVVTMGLPDLGRALRSQLYVYDGRTLRLNRDQDGLMACKDLIAQIQHHCGRCHREGRRQGSTVIVAACTEISYGVRLVVTVLEDRGDTRKRAFAFQTSQEDERVQQGDRVFDAGFLIATKRFQLEVGSPQQLRKPGSGDGILLSNVRHLAIDALIEPSEPDHVETGVRRYIVASDKRHRTASGGWLMVMHRGDSRL